MMDSDGSTFELATPALRVYLLGSIDFDAMLRLQRRLVYDVSEERSSGYLLLCEHPLAISVGREGSREHIHLEPDELAVRRCAVRWVNRGGGCLLHAPGQIAVYSVMALDHHGLDVRQYLDRLHAIARNVAAAFDIDADTAQDRPGIRVENRLLAHAGIAVRDWIAYFGLTINVTPDLNLFRAVDCDAPGREPMTSFERERRGAVRPAAVRQKLVDEFSAGFGWDRISLFHAHPALDGAAQHRRLTATVGT